MIRLENVSRIYGLGDKTFTALCDVNLAIERGEFVAVVGPSGSGKTTLLNIIAGIDKPTSGQVWVDGILVNALDEDRLARWRGGTVGIVFQFFQLLPTLTALENVMLPMELRGSYSDTRRQRAMEALARVGMADYAYRLPSELSGGEQQRVAIARALANDPPLLLADEPTGNLDTDSGLKVIELLAELNAAGETVIYITHEERLTSRARRIVFMRDGRIVGEQSDPASKPCANHRFGYNIQKI